MDGFKQAEREGKAASRHRATVLSIKQNKRRAGLADYVYGFVKEMILDGRLDQRETIQVDQIGKELEVSRQPVMDALKRLALEGFILILPQVGCQVRHYGPNEITDFYRLFAESEALIAELLAERATQSDLETLSSVSEQIGQLRGAKLNASEVNVRYRHLNRRLHFEIRRASRSLPVAEVVETLGDRSDFFVAASGTLLFADRLEVAHAQHEAIIAAAGRRDAVTARATMKQHILETEERIRMK